MPKRMRLCMLKRRMPSDKGELRPA
jgi:hypothetical protein